MDRAFLYLFELLSHQYRIPNSGLKATDVDNSLLSTPAYLTSYPMQLIDIDAIM